MTIALTKKNILKYFVLTELLKLNFLTHSSTISSYSIKKKVKVPVYITRLTSKLAAETLARARLRGISAFGEALTGSIGCTLRDIKPAQVIYYVTSPPIRSDPETPNFLLKSLAA